MILDLHKGRTFENWVNVCFWLKLKRLALTLEQAFRTLLSFCEKFSNNVFQAVRPPFDQIPDYAHGKSNSRPRRLLVLRFRVQVTGFNVSSREICTLVGFCQNWMALHDQKNNDDAPLFGLFSEILDLILVLEWWASSLLISNRTT